MNIIILKYAQQLNLKIKFYTKNFLNFTAKMYV